MKRIVCAATLTAVALLAVGCRRPLPEPSESVPYAAPAATNLRSVPADAPAPVTGESTAPAEVVVTPPAPAEETGLPASEEADAPNAENTAGEPEKPGVLGAIGRALRKSVVGDKKKDLDEARPFRP